MKPPTTTTRTAILVSILFLLANAGTVLAQKVEPDTDGKGTGTAIINTVSGSSGVSAPNPPPFVIPTTTTFVKVAGLPIADNSTTTSTISVSGMGPFLWDVDLITSIEHTFSSDLDITLTSPAGTEVTITTDNGAGNDDVFFATRFDDQGDTPVTDATYTDGVSLTPLVPEEALGAFIGENPNGVWTLEIFDDLGGDTGTLNRWRLAVTTFSSGLTSVGPVTFASAAALPIPDNGTATDVLTVAGVFPFLSDVNMTTNITHTFAADLEITLTSPAGTVVTITTDNGSSLDNIFVGTFWDDDAGSLNPPGPVTDNTFIDGVTDTPLVPEEAMAAFIGENPNGDWTLTVLDDAAADTGTLNSWSLDIRTFDPTLPVELTEFSARSENGDIVLNWETVSEVDNTGFEIQHAYGSDTWAGIGFVEGAGSSLQTHSYSYRVADLDPGVSRFRLMQVDTDGSYSYSKEIEVALDLPAKFVLDAYPNPFNPTTNLRFAVKTEQHVEVELFDGAGRKVRTLFSGVVSGNEMQHVTMDGSGLTSGMYLIQMRGETFVTTHGLTLLK